MDLDKRIHINDEQGLVQIPLSNFLRLFIIYGTPLVHEFLTETNTSDVISFIAWLNNKLGVKPEDRILL